MNKRLKRAKTGIIGRRNDQGCKKGEVLLRWMVKNRSTFRNPYCRYKSTRTQGYM